jgi:hypothetical protein
VTDGRELDPQAVAHQAAQLEQYLAKGGDAYVWLRSKDFAPDDRRAITVELSLRQAARGMALEGAER